MRVNLIMRVNAVAVRFFETRFQSGTRRVISVFSVDITGSGVDVLLRPVVCPHVNRPPIDVNPARVQSRVYANNLSAEPWWLIITSDSPIFFNWAVTTR